MQMFLVILSTKIFNCMKLSIIFGKWFCKSLSSNRVGRSWKSHGNFSFFVFFGIPLRDYPLFQITTCCMSPSAICRVRDRCGRSAGAAARRGAPAPGSLQVEQRSQTTFGPSAGGPPVSTAACFWKGTVLAAPERRLFPRRGVCDGGEERGGQRSA